MASSREPPPPPTTFHPFCRLPLELRTRIWSLNLPQARIVPVQCGSSSSTLTTSPSPSPSSAFSFSSSNSTSPSKTSPSPSGCTSPASIPANLHACAESRALAVASNYRLRLGFARQPGHVFFNPHRDILYFGPRPGYMAASAQFHTSMSLCEPRELAQVRSLAISESLFWIDDVYRSMTASRLTLEVLCEIRARMPALEELLFVPREQQGQQQQTTLVVAGSREVEVEELNDPMAAHVRLVSQIQAAFDTLASQSPDWVSPLWTVVPLGAVMCSV